MFRAMCIALCMLFLSACSADKIVLSLHSSNVINPDDQHQALALSLKIFQLKSLQDFKDKTFASIWQMTINKNIVAIQTVVVQSHESQTLSIGLDHQAKFVVIAADFRKAEGTQKLIIPLQTDDYSKQISILIHNNQIELGGAS